ATCEARGLDLGRQLVVNRDQFVGMQQVLDLTRMIERKDST
ncbi:MAG: hypothetical protein ACI8R4_004322, partial [Paracoccaceae bacterium]